MRHVRYDNVRQGPDYVIKLMFKTFLIIIDSANPKVEISAQAHTMACKKSIQYSSLALSSDNCQHFTQLDWICASLDRPIPLLGVQAGLPKKSQRR